MVSIFINYKIVPSSVSLGIARTTRAFAFGSITCINRSLTSTKKRTCSSLGKCESILSHSPKYHFIYLLMLTSHVAHMAQCPYCWFKLFINENISSKRLCGIFDVIQCQAIIAVHEWMHENVWINWCTYVYFSQARAVTAELVRLITHYREIFLVPCMCRSAERELRE